ncbi:MAG: hypothetical protein ACPGVO_23425 [Spirulinaceae cyanobacterium]
MTHSSSFLAGYLLQVYSLQQGQYQRLAQSQLPRLGLGLTVWEGKFEGKQYDRWLRWCDLDGNLLLTGDEQAVLEKQRTEQEKQRADAASQQIEQEKQRADAAAQEARKAEARAAHLAELLKAQGIELEEE